MPNADWWDAALFTSWGYVFFCLVICALYGMVLAALLFLGLAIRQIWRWITRGSWNRVIFSAEHRALRGK